MARRRAPSRSVWPHWGVSAIRVAPSGVQQLPSVESIARSKESLEADAPNGLNRRAAVEAIQRAQPTPASPAWNDILQQALNPMWGDMLAGKKRVLDGLREIKPKVDELLRAA